MRSSSTPQNQSVPDDLNLVDRMLAGDESAFESFFEGYFPALFRFTLSRVKDQDLARELVQSTLCKAIQAIHRFRREAPLSSWVFTICRNEISAHFRRLKRQPPPVEIVEEVAEIQEALNSFGATIDDPDRALQRKELARQVHGVLDRLPPRHGLALEWKYLEGLSVKEIALRLNVGPKAAESLLGRARKAFVEIFSGFGSRKSSNISLFPSAYAPHNKAVSHE